MSYEYERDEWKSAVRDMSELQRTQTCGHLVCVEGVCYDCGSKED